MDYYSSTQKTYITTTMEDSLGNVFVVNDFEVPSNQLNNLDELIAIEEAKYPNEPSRYVGYMVYYSTSAKTIRMDYFHYNGEPSNKYHADVSAVWQTTPSKKDYDILAIRWTNSATLIDAHGKQKTDDGRITNYSYLGNNMKTASNGVGISMNLHNGTSGHELEMEITFTASSIGELYGSYQHAINAAVTLNISKSYTFSSSGLGGVVYFSNSTYAGYYDGMQGVSLDYVWNINP